MKRITKKRSRLLCLLLAVLLCGTAWVLPGLSASAAEPPTSLGLAEHGLMAYRDGWQYVLGSKGQPYGDTRSSDCAGLLYSYFSDKNAVGNCQGGATSQVNVNCVFNNDIIEGIPNIHGLALTMPDYRDPGSGVYGHIGIYVGYNTAADNSDSSTDMRLEAVVGSGRNWTAWHVFDNGMQYPVDGWYAFDGKMVHYTRYEYDTDTVIDGYTIDGDGFAVTETGYAPVDDRLISSKYASASQVADYLRTQYSGVDSTSELAYNGNQPDPDPVPGCNGRVTGSGVNLRKEATTKSDVVTTLALGTGLNIVDETAGETVSSGGKTSNLWYSVTTPRGQSGYVSALFAEYTPVEALEAPVITAANGYVTMTAGSAAADIYYTTDGTVPDETSTPYTGPLYLVGQTYRAAAFLNGQKSGVTTATVLSSSRVFTDFTTDDWYYDAVDQAVSAAIFQGNGNGTFSPKKKITRAQFVMALANLDRVDLSLYSEPSGFEDLGNLSPTMSQAVSWAVKTGIVKGYSATSFGPNDPISREQMCVMLKNYAGVERKKDSAAFADDKKISSWARDAVYACRDNGLVQGVGQNRFDPKGTATRAQACVLTVNLYNMV